MDDVHSRLLEEIRKKIEQLRASERNRFDDDPMTLQMECELYDFSVDEKYLTLSFPVLKRHLNPSGTMMGGLICTALDMTYGILIFLLSEGHLIPPTITMTTNFIAPVFLDDTLLITAKIESWGKRIINMTATGVSKNTGKTIITSTTSFVGVESMKS